MWVNYTTQKKLRIFVNIWIEILKLSPIHEAAQKYLEKILTFV